MKWSCLPAVGLALLLAGAPTPASGDDRYDFTVLVRSGDMIDGKAVDFFFDSGPQYALAMNELGTVVFKAGQRGLQSCCPDGVGLFTSNRRLVGSEDILSGKKLMTVGPPATNNFGALVFRATFTDPSGARTEGIASANRIVVAQGATIKGKMLTSFGDEVLINDWGQVVFKARFNGGEGYFKTSDDIVTTGTIIDGRKLSFVGTAALTAWRGMVFSANTDTNTGGIFTARDVVISTGDVVDGRRLQSFGSPVMNEFGSLVFQASWFNGAESGSGLFNRDKLLAGTGSVINGRKLSVVSSAYAINNTGMLAFIAGWTEATTAGNGLFTPTECVIASGDTIEGKRVWYLADAIAVNDLGRIAFLARFTDGSSAIVLAHR